MAWFAILIRIEIGETMNMNVCQEHLSISSSLLRTRQLVTVFLSLIIAVMSLFFSRSAFAVPSFARQTGQSCVACHAGGQFPELTPYGRMFKLTGYTIGDRSNPLAAMIVASATKTQNNNDGAGGSLSPLDRKAILDFGSIFLAGKVTDNVGGFAQFTYSHYDHQDTAGNWHDHFGSDNFDLRYADRKVDDRNDLIWGLTLHNNPTVQDVWNSTPAWGYPYVSSTKGAFSGLPASTLVEGALAQHVAGVGGYVYWNNSIYAELTSYQTAKNFWSFLSMGNKTGDANHALTHLNGSSPYWRLAYTHERDAHNVMVGAFGIDAKTYPLDASFNPTTVFGSTRYKDLGFDAQYQYLLSPHTFTAQVRSIREKIDDSTLLTFGGPATLKTLKAKASYVYRATYGASLSYTDVKGSADATAYAGSALNVPDTAMWTPELFWIPKQNLRIGVQFNYFTRYFGAGTNYDGNGRNARDNNTTYLYLWTSF